MLTGAATAEERRDGPDMTLGYACAYSASPSNDVAKEPDRSGSDI